MKFGGTSVASLDHIRRVAARALAMRADGRDPIVVVSAMHGETNRLLDMAADMHAASDGRETDVIAATGEQVTAALTALAIQSLGGKSRSFLAHQLRLTTDCNYGDAAVLAVETAPLLDSLRRGEIPVVAGFQGVNQEERITTLGRGGSDTTAVAVAAAISAAACEIYTDVDGVYDRDPRQEHSARKYANLSYEAMAELAGRGAKVLHAKCIDLAAKYQLPIYVRSTFDDAPGTWIGRRPVDYCEQNPKTNEYMRAAKAAEATLS